MSNTVNSLDELIALIDEQQAERLILELDITRYSAEYAKALKRLTEAEAMQGRQLALDNAFISSKSEDIDYLRDQVEKLRPQSVKTVYVAFERLSARERSALDKRINEKKLTALQQYEEALPKMFLGIYSTPEADDDHLISADYKRSAARLTRPYSLVGTRLLCQRRCSNGRMVLVVSASPRKHRSKTCPSLGLC